MTRTWASTLLLVLLNAASYARAELFVLTSGGQVEGKVLNQDESPRQTFVIETSFGGVVTLPRNQVAKVVVNTDLKRYEDILPKMPNTADGHWKMSEWCAKIGLTSQKEFHLREILKLDPDHDEARRVLGYQKKDGNWLTTEEILLSQGFVRFKGGWRLQQDIDLTTQSDKYKQAVLECRREVKRLRSKFLERNGDKALEELKAIRNPAAAPAIVDLLEEKGEPTHLRRVYIDLLARLPSAAAVSALCQRVLLDEDSNIRDKSLDHLVDMHDRQVMRFFILKLKDSDNAIVNRAGLALARLQEADSTVPLIEALSTKHKRQVGSGSGSISPTFSGDGGGGLSMGGGAKVIEQDVPNQSVLNALTILHPGINFGFDKAAWKRWYAESNTPKNVNLRRDP